MPKTKIVEDPGFPGTYNQVPVTPDMVITDIHRLAEEMGAQRLRIDRSGWDEGRIWFEVGYGSGEIHIRTSQPDLVYRCETTKVELDDVTNLFEELLDGDPEMIGEDT